MNKNAVLKKQRSLHLYRMKVLATVSVLKYLPSYAREWFIQVLVPG